MPTRSALEHIPPLEVMFTKKKGGEKPATIELTVLALVQSVHLFYFYSIVLFDYVGLFHKITKQVEILARNSVDGLPYILSVPCTLSKHLWRRQ